MGKSPVAFVAMAFDGRLQPVYLKVIQPVLTQHGFECTRADEESSVGIVINQIRKAIKSADLMLCDLTYLNPNVFYELGIAHAVGTKPILLSQDAGNLPFDVAHIRVIPYEDSKFGLLDLREKLVEVLEAMGSKGTAAGKRKRQVPPVSKDELQEQRIALFSSSPEFKRWAVKFLGDHRDKESYGQIEQIAVAVENYDADLKREAFTALYKINAKGAREVLSEHGLRRQPHFLVRERAVELLGMYEADKSLLKLLEKQAWDSSWGVRRQVCEVLGRWGEPSSVSTLRMLLSDSQVEVSLAAVEALGRLPSTVVPDADVVKAEAKDALDRIRGPLIEEEGDADQAQI